jgi:peroxiredoxin
VTSSAVERRVPPTLTLQDPHGSPKRLGDVLTSSWSVVQLVRYFGCLPCQEWLVDLDRSAPVLAGRDATVSAVGGSADYQARWLQRERGVTMPLLLDPHQSFRAAVGLARPLGIALLSPRGLAAYGRSMAHGYRPQRVTRDTVRSPGVVILDAGLRVRWQHVGRRLGDYPALTEVHAALEVLARGD